MIKNIDWSKIIFRASTMNILTSDPKSKADKDAGELSESAKSLLNEIYIENVWGITKDIQNKYTNKGNLCEEDGITLLSQLDKVLYEKNTERFTDEFFTGMPDIIHDHVDDNKCSWDAFTFIQKMNKPLDPLYWSQMQIYLHLTGKKKGKVSYTLVDTPDSIILEEQKKLFYKMGALTEESPEYLEACEYIRLSSTYSHIPIEFRAIRFDVDYDQDYIEKAKQKVIKGRQYLSELHYKHLYLNKK